MRHIADERNGIRRDQSLWHADPKLEQFVIDLFEKTKPAQFVETGSHMGWTSAWIAERFPHLPVYTVEVTEHYYHLARENLAPYPNASVSHDSSPDFLKKLFPLLSVGAAPTIFWLDAHWYPPVPLRKECEIVAQLDRYICLLDDFFCYDPDFNGDIFDLPNTNERNCLQYVEDILGPKCWRPNYPAPTNAKGYGLFLKNVKYEPPSFMKEDVLK